MSKNLNSKELTPKELIRISCRDNEYFQARNFLKELIHKCYWNNGKCSATDEELRLYRLIDKFLEDEVKKHIDNLSKWYSVSDEQVKEYISDNKTD